MVVRLLITTTLFFICGYNYSQEKKLIESVKNSGARQIYTLTDKQAFSVYKHGVDQIDDNYFSHLHTSIPIDSSLDNNLPIGHYISIFTDRHLLKSEVFSITDFTIEVGNNQSDLFIQLWQSGKLIKNAELRLENRKIKFNSTLNGYWKRKTNKSGLLEITMDSKKWYYHLNKDLKNSRFKRISQKLVYGTPIKHIVTPIIFTLELPIHGVKSIIQRHTYGNIGRIKYFGIRTYEKFACLFEKYYCQNDYNNRFRGYAITNQPKYRKGDTVKFKALNLSKKGRPKGSKPLKLYLRKSWSDYKLLSEIEPYRKGGYSYNLVLHDSLQLKLDKSYGIAIGKS
ncbi:MAG: hypothetical protein AAF843_18315, partial [Bacteroidota bacterium]